MKLKIAMLALALPILTLSALKAQAGEGKETAEATQTRTSRVTYTEMDPQITRRGVNSGTIKYNLSKKVVTIKLKKNGTCGFASCDNLEMEINLPIIEAKSSNCGFRIVAQQDRRPVDGLFERVEMVDYSSDLSRRLCKIAIAPNEVVRVHYITKGWSRMNRTEVTTSSQIFGTQSVIASFR